jgi:hypothetical protein
MARTKAPVSATMQMVVAVILAVKERLGTRLKNFIEGTPRMRQQMPIAQRS